MNFPGKNTEVGSISFSGDLPDPGIKARSSTLQEVSLPSEPPGKERGLSNTHPTPGCVSKAEAKHVQE